jgi:adenine phosphoribosyltransferase
MSLQEISNLIEVWENYKGVNFRDMSKLLADPVAFNSALDLMQHQIEELLEQLNQDFDYFAMAESRGFLFAGLARKMNKPMIMLRKADKMLPNVITIEYQREYGEPICLAMQKDLVKKGSRVIILDDLVATGGTVNASCQLIEQEGSQVIACGCLIQLTGFAKEKLSLPNNLKICSLLKFHCESTSKVVNEVKMVEYLPLKHDSEDNKVVVFSHPTIKYIEDSLINMNSDLFRHGTIKWGHFPDNSPNIQFEYPLTNKRIVIIMNLLSPEHLLEQLSIMHVLPKQYIKSLDIIIPYFSVGTMDRVDEEGIVATADTLAKIISECMINTIDGPPRMHIVDIHTTHERFYFANKANIKLISAMPLLLSEIDNQATIVFPDDGAHKRFGKYFLDRRCIVCSKIRDGNERRITIKEKLNFPKDESIAWRNLVIVDDLVQSGNTLEECRKALKALGAGDVSAFTTHAIFPNKSYNKFIDNNSFTNFYTTNTTPVWKSIGNKKPFIFLDVTVVIYDSLCHMFIGKDIPKMHSKETLIYVTSTNETKMSAVYDSYVNFYKNNLKVIGFNVKSNVSEQPIDFETYQGCENRIANLIEHISAENISIPNYILSIENGIFIDKNIKDSAHDACIVTECEIDKVKENISKSSKDSKKVHVIKTITQKLGDTKVPMEYLEESIRTNKTKTVGSIIEEIEGLPKGKWHEYYGNGVSRKEIIKQIIKTFR